MYLVFISKLFVSQIILGKHMPFVCERIFLSWFPFFKLALGCSKTFSFDIV